MPAAGSNARGAFILFEGVDRCGKTTQSKRLAEYLASSRPVELIRFPDRSTTLGGVINSFLTNQLEISPKPAHLLFTANRWEVAPKIQQLIDEGTTVLVDRYSYSGAAYTAANYEGIDLSWCFAPEKGLPKPDAVIYLDIPIEETKRRGGFGQERYENEDLQLKVRKNFLALSQDASASWHILNAARTVDELALDIQKIADECVEKVKLTPLGYL